MFIKYVADMFLWQNCWFTKYVGSSESFSNILKVLQNLLAAASRIQAQK